MNAILESVAARAANGWQLAGAKFDFDVLAMPGGSVMAPALWVYSLVTSALKRPASASAAAGAALRLGDTVQPPAGVYCDWSGCHCA